MKKLNLFFLLLISVFSYQSYLGQNVPVSTCSTNVDNFSYSVMRSSTTANDKQRMAFIIPASQLIGLTGGTITSTFFRRPTASGSLGAGTTFKIYLKNTSAVDFGSAAIDWATETGTAVMVYNADPQAAVGSTAGDKKFEHSTNFVYTAGSNIAVYTEYVQTAAQATNIYWQYEYSSPCINTSNSNTTKYVNTTSAFGATLTSTNYRRPVIGFDATFPPAVAAPACTTMSSPASNATGVSVNPTFTWAPVTGQNAATSYLINLGTTPGGTNVMNGVDVGNVTTYTLPSATTLNFSQQYYVTIIPKNSIGNATGCTERSFTTGNVACPPVTSPASAAVGVLTTPTITWTASSGATGYKITMGTTSGGSDILNNVDVGNVTTYTLANALNNSTIYYYTVNAYSGTNNSASCTVRSFTTVCTAENAPTATQVFSTYLPACWTAAKGTVAASSTLTYGTSKWASESGFANTGTNAGVRINLYDANPGDWLISQEINLGSTPGLYRVKYKMAVTSYLGTTAQTTLGSHLVRLIVSTDGGATWSNTNVIKTYTGAAAYSSTGQTETVNLTAYSGSVKVAFVATTTSTTPDIDFHIDDFVVEAIPSCEAPTAITSSLVTTSSATISWTAPATVPANGYEYYYSTSNTAPTAATAASGTSTAATAPLSGLASATTYYVWVRSVCSTSSSSVWSTSGTFTTLCNATGVPYTLDFTSVTTPALPTCTSAVNSGSGNTWVTYSPGATGFTGNVLNYTFNSTNAANTWFFTQGILSAHPLDEFKYHYQFMQGRLSKKAVLEKEDEVKVVIDEVPILETDDKDEAVDISEIISDDIVAGEEEIIEEAAKKAEPKGNFGFLNLDEVDAYKEQAFANKPAELFEEKKKDWKTLQKERENGGSGKEYTVAGLITEYVVKDGFKSGEKVAFLTLEDYSGSYSFRLGDRDYMRLKEKLEVQRFVILKIKYAQVKDGRVFVNVIDVIELQEAFEKYAKSISLVMDVMDFRREDLEFFRNVLDHNKGNQKFKIFIKNSEENSDMELQSMRYSVDLNGDLIKEIQLLNKYEFYLN